MNLFLLTGKQFSCQGVSYAPARSRCPDYGILQASAGGNVTIVLHSARNLPNADHTGPSAKVSDPYVKFTVGASHVVKSSVIKNSLFPKWNEERVNLGILGSATNINIEIWDKDIGLEYTDDRLVSGSMRVPFCSHFNSNFSTVGCEQPFGCRSEDSLWSMPTRKLCSESGYFNFNLNPHDCASKLGVCLYFTIEIVPFTMTVEPSPQYLSVPPKLTAAATFNANAEWTYQFTGSPFFGGQEIFDLKVPDSAYVKGALMLRTSMNDKSVGKANSIKFYASVNFPAFVYVCRDQRDNGRGIPSWIKNGYNAQNVSVTRFFIQSTQTYFGCFFYASTGTVKNRYGGIKSGVLAFRANTIENRGSGTIEDPTFYFNNYFVLAVPRLIVHREDVIDIVFDSNSFVNSLLAYGVVWSFFLYFVARFLDKIDYRIDRLSTYVSGRVLTGENRSILAGLLTSYGQTPSNVEYRAHLFHGRNALAFILMSPNLLIISWGFSIASYVQPAALGYFIVFVGQGIVLFWFGFRLWERGGWSMSPIAITAQASAVVLFFCFMISVIFVDPAVKKFHQTLNFAALSTIFGTMNVIPLMLLVFKQDKTFKSSFNKLVDKMNAAVSQAKNRASDRKKPVAVNKLLHALLGHAYTINPHVPIFKFAAVLQETDLVEEFSRDANDSAEASEETNAQSLRAAQNLYYVSLVLLLVYLLIGVTRTSYPSLAVLNVLALVLLDTIHTALNHGDIDWSPGYKITILVIGRLLVMTSSGSQWLLAYCLVYILYSTVLVQEIINNSLPILSDSQAGRAVFVGVEEKHEKSPDIAGTPQFCFGFLTFSFIAIVLISAFGGTKASLPVPNIAIWGASWPVYVFGLIAVCFIITGGLLSATARAFYLEKHGLLQGWAKENYMLRKQLNVPMILAIFSEISIISSGVMVYGATKSSSILTLSIFLPPIIVCLAHAFRSWTSNDYDLILWPPIETAKAQKNDTPSDLEVAFNMIENIFGDEDAVDDVPETSIPQERTLKGFKLPSLEATGNKVDGQIKMPPLPLKSVLRKKRTKLGIKTKNPLVKDLKLREGADVDKFGTGDIIDANDPWAQFEEKPVEKKKEKKKATVFTMERYSWFEHPYITQMKDAFLATKLGKSIVEKVAQCWQSLQDRRRKYSRIDIIAKMTGEEEEEDENESELARLEREEAEAKAKAKQEEDSLPVSERISRIPFWKAAAMGYLTRSEYITLLSWFGGLFLIMVMGITLARTVRPSWMGYVVWIAIWVFLFTFVPVVKYFNTYVVDDTMKYMMYFNAVLHVIFCASFWGGALNHDITLPASLWMLDYFFYYPAFLYLLVELYRWRDSDFAVSVLDKDGDNDVSIAEFLDFFKAYPVLMGMMIILTWQLYLWINYLIGNIALIFLLVSGFGYIFVRDWATNDFFLSPEMATLGMYMIYATLIITFGISIFMGSNPTFPLSLFFFSWIFICVMEIVTRFMVADADTKLFFSPFVFPVYSFNPRTSDIVDETPIAKKFLHALAAGGIWGACTATFLYPVNVGIGVACGFLLVIAAIVASTIIYVPMSLGLYSSLLSPEMIVEAANVAVTNFEKRKNPLELEMDNFHIREMEDDAERPKTAVEKHKERTSLDLAVEMMNETRALNFVQDDSEYLAAQSKLLLDEDEEISWYKEYWDAFKAHVKKLYEFIPLGQMKGWRKHSEGLFTITDALAETIITGKGPYGMFGLDGKLYSIFKYAQSQPRLKFLQQPWLNTYDEHGNSKNNVALSEPMDVVGMLAMFTDLDKGMQHTYFEETRCAIHFLLLLMVAADANLQREQVLFQKFLRENRFRLASNGISPPSEIFSSSSFASINIPLVAAWLSTLSSEERERFHLLKAAFSDEQKIRDEAIDHADYEESCEGLFLQQERRHRELEMSEKMSTAIAFQQEQRIQAFAETLQGGDKKVFAAKREIWVHDPECFVMQKDEELYEKFKAACFQETDEAVEYARKTMAEIEAAQKDCHIGEYGRVYQFVDSEFMPSEASIGECRASTSVLGWRCAPGISESAQLFDSGTDPDDVQQGIFQDGWLLSAISMLAAAGGVGDGGVDEQIMNLFIGHLSIDGEVNFNTELGVYCVRLFKQGAWIPIILDDLFPMLRGSEWNNDNRGMACAHSKECKELWVPLLEKAYAKYYGSYAALARGYTHHALQDLTGCDAECISLAQVGRGMGKRALWDQLIRYKKNGYILGAGTGDSSLADKGVLDMGIIFNAAYTIYDIKAIDGKKLVKLRNPPGDHEEWRGDWSDQSTLWSRRLKYKFSFVDANDNTFFMSFDDFCNVFRHLYVCKWYNPNKWSRVAMTSFWKKPNELDDEQQEMMRQMMQDEGVEAQVDGVKSKRKKAKAEIDTAGGMPTRHNPGCVLENNPHFCLVVHRNTEIRISVSQVDARGRGNREVHPITIMVLKNDHHSVPMRLQSLKKDNMVSFTKPTKEKTIHLHETLKPGVYVVVVPTYLSGMEGNFTVSLVSNYRCKFYSIWPPKWMLKDENIGRAHELLDGGAGAAKDKIDQVGKYFKKASALLFGATSVDDSSDEEDEDADKEKNKRDGSSNEKSRKS